MYVHGHLDSQQYIGAFQRLGGDSQSFPLNFWLAYFLPQHLSTASDNNILKIYL